MALSIQSVVNITTLIKYQLENREKAFRRELKECSVETRVDEFNRNLEVLVNGVLVWEEYANEVSDNSIILTIEDIELFLNNKLKRTKY